MDIIKENIANKENGHKDHVSNPQADINNQTDVSKIDTSDLANSTITNNTFDDSQRILYSQMPTVPQVFSHLSEASFGWRNFKGIHIDTASKILFPLSFGFFSLAYWLVYRS